MEGDACKLFYFFTIKEKILPESLFQVATYVYTKFDQLFKRKEEKNY